jgi:hypothetical protein
MCDWPQFRRGAGGFVVTTMLGRIKIILTTYENKHELKIEDYKSILNGKAKFLCKMTPQNLLYLV